MRILVTGKGGKSGSWKMRGEQLGGALGAAVKPNATDPADVTLVVKRTPLAVIAALKGRKWVWDIVDAYPQPASYAWTRDQAIAWVHGRLAQLQPTAVIWPTQRMREDCDFGLPGVVIPHHHRAGIERNPIREQVRTVAYEGAPTYLGRWADWIEDECIRRGWQFMVNPPRLSDADIVIAVRDGGGYVSRHWKSGVKLANAHGSGTPFIGNRECGYLETAEGAEYWADDRKELVACLDLLTGQRTRREVGERFQQQAYSVERAADDLKAWLHGL